MTIALLALPAIACIFVAWRSLREALRRATIHLEDYALAFAWLFPVGALVWLGAYLTGNELLGFGEPWTWLTAAHFTFAGFGAWTITCLLTRLARGPRAYRAMLVLVAIHPLAFAATAAGITGVPGCDEAGSVAYGIVFATQALLYPGLRPKAANVTARSLLAAAVCVPVITLVPAITWAFGAPAWDLDQMVRYHGLANAIGHVVLGLGVLAWIRPGRRADPAR